MASDWLAAVLPANQMPGLKIFVKEHGFYMEISQVPDDITYPQ